MAASLRSLMTLVACNVRCSLHSRAAWKSFSTSGKETGKKDGNPAQDPERTTLRDPFPIFVDQQVQELLTRITGFDALKIAGPHLKPLRRPKYKLLTDRELAKELEVAHDKMKRRLQMPPYMNPRKDNLTPLSVDPDLAGFDTSKYVFTDISYGVRDRKRSVLVREPDGTLKVAPWDVKERMNHIYNQREGREYLTPTMFEEQHLERMIAEKRYLYILDRACCQCEPDDPVYIRVTHRVYNALNAAQEFDVLRSTRHFGPFAFYLAWNNMIDYLLLDMIRKDLLSDAKDVILLYCKIHPDSQCSSAVSKLKEVDPSAVIKAYIESDSRHKSQLELVLQAAEDAKRTEKSKKVVAS